MRAPRSAASGAHVADASLHPCAQWKDVAIEAAKAALILAILERLFLTSNASWLEARTCDWHCAV